MANMLTILATVSDTHIRQDLLPTNIIIFSIVYEYLGNIQDQVAVTYM